MTPFLRADVYIGGRPHSNADAPDCIPFVMQLIDVSLYIFPPQFFTCYFVNLKASKGKKEKLGYDKKTLMNHDVYTHG